jgi:hypothetical protein
MDPRLKIIEECAIELCRFFKHDPNETIQVPLGVGALTTNRALKHMVAGRVYEAVVEISKLDQVTTPLNNTPVKD